MITSPHLPRQITLKKNEDRRISAGHPWVFSNEIREIRGTPLIGDVVEVISAAGKTLGIGFYNPHSLIAVRLLSRQIEEIDAGFFRGRIEEARRLRETLFPGAGAYRLIHGEADFLPGLIVDRFGGSLVVQTLSFGMDARLPVLCDLLEELFRPDCIVERNESPLRALDGLPLKKGPLRGSPGEVTFEESGLLYTIHPLEGQKTGFFLDQRDNRTSVRRYCPGAEVLDCFCNDGGFALNAARGGAKSILAIDSSGDAVRRASVNAERNGIGCVTFEEADVFERLATLAGSGRIFDLVILDPPSFTRSRKNVQTARKGYRDLHMAAFRLLHRGGTLLSASCSHHIEPDVFLEIIDDAARRTGRTLQLLEWHGAAPDHPTLPAVPETRYLKAGIFKIH